MRGVVFVMQCSNTEEVCAAVDIRLAETNDAVNIESILSKSFEEYEERYTRAAFVTMTPPKVTILKRMKEGPVWVAIEDGKIVGTVSAVPKGRELCLRGLAVLPAERGKAIGRLLLVHLGRYAVRNGYRKITLSTTPFLTRAIREYEQFGFQRSEDGPHELHGTPIYKMVKQL